MGKRKIILYAFAGAMERDSSRYFIGAPTRDQAKRIYWADLKSMIPRNFIKSRSEVELWVRLYNGSEIWVVGLDKPERIEGSPWDGGVLDEFANMKATAWGENIRPALADRNGWCDFIGVPESRNHYFDLFTMAEDYQRSFRESGVLRDPDWDSFTWPSSDILDPAEIEQAKRELDELTFKQEFEASFVTIAGRVYYAFERDRNVGKLRNRYNPQNDLLFAFDFNVAPGVAAIGQEMTLPNGLEGTGWFDEVHIKRNSNTIKICNELIERYGGLHKGPVYCFGDATGGASGTAKIQSDWAIIQNLIVKGFPANEVRISVPKANPREKDRVNAMNSRLRTLDGQIRMMVDEGCKNIIDDFESVLVLEGSSGQIDDSDPEHGHLTDAIGYYVHRRFPVKKVFVVPDGPEYIDDVVGRRQSVVAHSLRGNLRQQ